MYKNIFQDIILMLFQSQRASAFGFQIHRNSDTEFDGSLKYLSVKKIQM